MVGLSLGALKVPRRAVRILVLTVRFATARRRATPLECRRTRPLPACTWGGGVSVLDQSESGSRSVTQRPVTVAHYSTRADGSTVGFLGRGRCSLDWFKHGGGVGATCTIAVSRGGSF